VSENPSVFEEYRQGKERALNFLVGAVMKKTKGRADAGKVKEMLKGMADVPH
ncbi:Asp-tRNA(Asn)/Glu-tRNA(Gln) amidotransferase GatCAB subunit B, partial [Candidatus Woesearchaeota archaeon CG_4_10_14_0_8_um_filter_47_5]